MDQGVHQLLMEKLDDELEGSGFVFQCLDVILELYKVDAIQPSSWVELPEKFEKNPSIINIKNDQLCFSRCILTHLYLLRTIKIEDENMLCICLR